MGAGESRQVLIPKLPVVWLEEAAFEFRGPLQWYIAIGPKLGERFAHAVESTVEAISVAPLNFTLTSKGSRRAGVRRFPYGLYFMVEEERLVVIACFHGKRSPKTLHQRTESS